MEERRGPGGRLGTELCGFAGWRAGVNVASWFLWGHRFSTQHNEAQCDPVWSHFCRGHLYLWIPNPFFFKSYNANIMLNLIKRILFSLHVFLLISLIAYFDSLINAANQRQLSFLFYFRSLAGQRSSTTLGVQISSGSLSWISSLRRNKT